MDNREEDETLESRMVFLHKRKTIGCALVIRQGAQSSGTGGSSTLKLVYGGWLSERDASTVTSSFDS